MFIYISIDTLHFDKNKTARSGRSVSAIRCCPPTPPTATMAAPTLNNVASPITTASILSELKFFVKCVSTTHKLHADVAEKLVKCSLHLLRELPSARELVFEYFAMSFDVSVGSHMQFVEKEPNGTAPEDETIADIQDALESLVNSGPHSWAPLISAWALRLLGTLSHKFSRGRPMGEHPVASNGIAIYSRLCINRYRLLVHAVAGIGRDALPARIGRVMLWKTELRRDGGLHCHAA